MAWNEPGGNDNDPWGNRKNSGGPPDLDEFFKNFSKKFGGMFGNSGRGGGGTQFPGGNLSGMAMSIIIAGLLVLWFFFGFYIVQPAESAVVTQFGRHVTTTQAGLNWHIPWPVQKVERVNTQEIKSSEVARQLALTQDENLVEIALNVQYRIGNAEDYLFNVRKPDDTVKQAAESALREVVGRTDMNPLITFGRDVVRVEVEANIQSILRDYVSGIEVTQVNLTHSEAPEQVRGAFEDVIKAREDRERFINEAEAYRNEIRNRAGGDATRMLEEAEAYRARVTEASVGESQRFLALLEEYKKAPKVTRDRLYIESMEHVLGNTSKVLVDSDSGNNLMYLPIDKLINNAGSGFSSGTNSTTTIPSSTSVETLRVPTTTSNSGSSNREGFRSRDRGGNQ